MLGNDAGWISAVIWLWRTSVRKLTQLSRTCGLSCICVGYSRGQNVGWVLVDAIIFSLAWERPKSYLAEGVVTCFCQVWVAFDGPIMVWGFEFRNVVLISNFSLASSQGVTVTVQHMQQQYPEACGFSPFSIPLVDDMLRYQLDLQRGWQQGYTQVIPPSECLWCWFEARGVDSSVWSCLGTRPLENQKVGLGDRLRWKFTEWNVWNL